MILRQGRFVAVAAFVVFAAFFLGLGTLLTGAQPASRPRQPERAAAAQRSGDDDGFSPSPLHGQPRASGPRVFEVVGVPTGIDAAEVSPVTTTESSGLTLGGLYLQRPVR